MTKIRELEAHVEIKATRISCHFVEAIVDEDDESDEVWMAIEGLPGSSWEVDDIDALADELKVVARRIRELRGEGS